MVDEILRQLRDLYDRETAFFSKPFPLREEGVAAESYLQEMNEIVRELSGLEQDSIQELRRIAAGKGKEKEELAAKLFIIRELYRKRRENIALLRRKLQEAGIELDLVQKEKKALFYYRPGKKMEAGFIDSRG